MRSSEGLLGRLPLLLRRRHGWLPSVPDGRVRLSWRIEEGDGDRTMLITEWREENGPTVRQPTRRGYGTELITTTAKHLGGSAEQRFDPRGLIATVKLPI